MFPAVMDLFFAFFCFGSCAVCNLFSLLSVHCYSTLENLDGETPIAFARRYGQHEVLGLLVTYPTFGSCSAAKNK